jgi:hypothetical protein
VAELTKRSSVAHTFSRNHAQSKAQGQCFNEALARTKRAKDEQIAGHLFIIWTDLAIDLRVNWT